MKSGVKAAAHGGDDEGRFMESHLFEIDLLTALEPRNCKSLEINETISRFMERAPCSIPTCARTMNWEFRGAGRPPLRQAGRPPLRTTGSWRDMENEKAEVRFHAASALSKRLGA